MYLTQRNPANSDSVYRYGRYTNPKWYQPDRYTEPIWYQSEWYIVPDRLGRIATHPRPSAADASSPLAALPTIPVHTLSTRTILLFRAPSTPSLRTVRHLGRPPSAPRPSNLHSPVICSTRLSDYPRPLSGLPTWFPARHRPTTYQGAGQSQITSYSWPVWASGLG